MFGSIANVDHKGGSMVFKLKDTNADDITWSDFSEIGIGLNIDLPVKIDYDCKVPLFKENKVFDHSFVNAYVQQMAYQIIGDARQFFTNLPQYLVSDADTQFDLNIGFKIHTLNNKIFSMTLSTESYFGGAHPNTSISSLNVAFGPERKIDLGDFIVYSGSFENFITKMIQYHSESPEQKILLMEHVSYITSDVDFSISEDILKIYFIGYLPRVHMPYAFLEIPLNKLDLKI